MGKKKTFSVLIVYSTTNYMAVYISIFFKSNKHDIIQQFYLTDKLNNHHRKTTHILLNNFYGSKYVHLKRKKKPEC